MNKSKYLNSKFQIALFGIQYTDIFQQLNIFGIQLNLNITDITDLKLSENILRLPLGAVSLHLDLVEVLLQPLHLGLEGLVLRCSDLVFPL